MNLGEFDWGVLKGALALFFICTAVSVSLLSWSYYFWGKMNGDYRRQHASLMSIRSKYQTVDDEERIMESYLPRYRDLEERGIVGPEQRLNWVEALRDASAQVKLPSLRYSIDAQAPYEADFPLTTGEFGIFASKMTLDLGLLHEGDLPAVLMELDRYAAGHYSVASCDIQRKGREFGRSAREANLQAICDLNWFTIRPPDLQASRL